MKRSIPRPPVSICVLTYGDYPRLARRCLDSVRQFCERSLHQLIVGANAAGPETREYLENLHRAGEIDHLLLSRKNLRKYPMMRRMLARANTEFVWWFDDDSSVTKPWALPRLLCQARRESPSTVMWGAEYCCDHPSTNEAMPDPVHFVRSARWYRGLTPPSWEPGGKGEFNYQGRGTGDGRWLFITGGCWLARTSALRALDWPDKRLVTHNGDIMLGEALRQRGWYYRNVGSPGFIINDAPRRGEKSILPAAGR
jgi:GT2 family glycosyltransferase